jgi:signal transduction histidine kinase
MASPDTVQFDALAQMLNSSVLLLDRDANLGFASSHAHSLFGLTDTEQLKRTWAECYAKLQLPVLGELARNGTPLRHRCELRTPKSIRLLQIDVFPLQYAHCEHYLILLNDLQVMDDLQRQFMSASHDRAHQQLISALVHDLNGPINTMRITLELMDRMPSVSTLGAPVDFVTQWERYKGIVRQELGKLKTQVAELPHSFGSAQNVPPAIFDIRGAIKDIGRLLKHEATSKHIHLDLSLPESPVMTVGYFVEIRLALLNLAQSLLVIAEPGSCLQIHTIVVAAKLAIVLSVRPLQSNKQAIEDCPKIEFQRHENDVDLFVARQIINAHGGDIKISSLSENQCAEIRVLLALSVPQKI